MIEEVNSLLVVDAQIRPINHQEEYDIITASVAEHVKKFPDADLTDKLSLAAPSPVIDGKPRMLHITAMIVHEGINRNGDLFIAEELRDAVQKSNLFAEGYAGVIDLDHDFKPIGYWYKSEFVNNPKTGTQGILAHGAIWAYLNPLEADRILAQQTRDGYIRVSMACLSKAEDVEFHIDEESGRLIKTMHNPVFLGATVLLDRDAGDKDATGIAEEDPLANTKQERRKVVLKAASVQDNKIIKLEEKAMIEEIRPLLAELLGDQSEKFTDAISNLVQEKLDGFKNLLDEKDALIVEANGKIENLTAEIDSLNTQLEEKDLAIENLRGEKSTLDTELESTKEALATFVTEKEAREFEEKKENRLSELSVAAKERLMAKEEEIRDAILTRWAKQSDEEWEITKSELSLTSEGHHDAPLPGVGNGDAKSIEHFLN